MPNPKSADVEGWYETCYSQLVSQPDVLRAARVEVARLAAGGPLTPQNADLQAARPYLRRCVMNMSVVELESITSEAAGALWARGAIGAARYQVDGGRPKRRGRRFKSRRTERGPRSQPEDDD